MAYNDFLNEVAKRKFADSMFEMAAQVAARLRAIVEIEPVDAEDLVLDRIHNVEVQEHIGRHPEIVPVDMRFDRRKLITKRVGVAFFVDEWDRVKVSGELDSKLAKRAGQAFERYFDRMVVAASLATVYTGKNGTTALSAASDDVVTVDCTSSGFTYDKLLEIDEKFQKYDIGTDMPVEKYLLISEQEHTALMKETKLISGDYSRQFVVDNGEIQRALGFKLIKFGSGASLPVLTVASTTRNCIALAAGGVKVGLTKSYKIEKEKVNNRWYTDQILASGNMGAVRMEGRRVIQVNTTAS